MAAASDDRARSAEADKLWDGTSVDPVELHLGKHSGYTLRAYRMSDTLPAGSAVDAESDEGAEPVEVPADGDRAERRPDIAEHPEDEDDEAPSEADFLDEEEVDALDAAPEEVPVFLTRKGRLLVFHDPESLVRYVRESDDHDLAAIEEYADLQKRITAEA